MVFTDPPYNMDFTGGIHADGTKSFNSKHGKIKNDKLSKNEADVFFDSVNNIIASFCIGAFYITFYRLGILDYWQSLERVGLKVRSLIIWNKGNHTLSNSDYMSKYEPIFYGWVNDHKFYGGNNGMDIWDIKRTQKNDLHPTMKPLELVAKAIEDGSAKGQSVLDIFGGSGTTLIAAEQLSRNCYCLELDPKYVDVIIRRWQNLTGKEAKLEETGKTFNLMAK
jgi:DNA modification methylase